jgi:hypothetical protein
VKKFAFLLLLPLFAQALVAQDEPDSAWYNTFSRELTLQVSTAPEIKLGFTQRYSFPFLQGGSPLTEGNNIGAALSAEITPISLNAIAEAVLTPVAFFQFSVGGRIGTGWNLNLFGSDLYGIGLNGPDVVGNSANYGSAFDGLLWKAQAGGTVQFDLAALYPGDWNHVVALSYHEINYKGYTKAKTDESWYYENDSGENINGFNYYGNLLIGYQMPMRFNMAAILAETDLYLYDTPGRDTWGDDIVRWTLSGVFGININAQMDLTLIAQFRTRRNYLESGSQELYYRYRTIDTSSPTRLEFYRIAAALTYRL